MLICYGYDGGPELFYKMREHPASITYDEAIALNKLRCPVAQIWISQAGNVYSDGWLFTESAANAVNFRTNSINCRYYVGTFALIEQELLR